MFPRESVLGFKTFADFATDDDIESQEEQRLEAWWGRMYMEGMPFSIQYFRCERAARKEGFWLFLTQPIFSIRKRSAFAGVTSALPPLRVPSS